MSPTALSLRLLRQCGYVAAVAERWIPGRNIRVDLFGCGDLVACHRAEPGPLMIQATTASNLSSRIKKAQAQPGLRAWLACGGRFECWGWSKIDGEWTVKRVQIHPQDLAAIPAEVPRRRKRVQERGLFDDVPCESVARASGEKM